MAGHALYVCKCCNKQSRWRTPNLHSFLWPKFLTHYSDIVMEERRLGSSLEGNGKVFSCFLPSSLETAQVAHVCIAIDVVWFEWERLEISLFSFLGSICEGTIRWFGVNCEKVALLNDLMSKTFMALVDMKGLLSNHIFPNYACKV